MVEPSLHSAAPGNGRRGASAFSMRQTLEALAASENTAIVGTDADARITSWGAGAEALYGWTADEIVGETVLLFTPPELIRDLMAVRRRLMNGETVQGWITERLHKDGSRVPVSIDLAPIHDESGTVVGTASVHRSIADQLRVEAALRVADERYRTMVDTLPALVYQVTLGEQNEMIYMSPRAAELYGIPFEELQPARVRELLHPDDRDRVLAEMAKADSELAPLALEYRVVRPDGSVVWLEDRSVVLEGDPPRAQGYILDISDRKRLEEQLHQSQKMDAVGQLAGGIAHDFNNILTAIEGYTEFALQRAGEDVELRDDLHEIRKAARRAATLTGQILAYSRRQVLRSRPLDLNEVIDETKKLVLRLIGEHIQVVSRLEVPLGSVMADPSQITQVIVNLAVNARDAMPGGGRLTVETTNVELDHEFAHRLDLAPGRYVTLAVTDTGIGMDAETAKRVFEPFFTTKPVGSGSGLGLSMVYGIVRQSGGAVFVDSEPGRGTIVRVYLPRSDEAVPAAGRVEGPEVPALGSGTVLLVEDEPVIRRLVAEMLSRQGYEVLTAPDASAALELAGSTEVDLVVTDVVMPGLSGPELAVRLGAERVLFISGYPADAIADNGVLPADATILHKPFSAVELLAAVAETIGA
jgi:two-component system, cell cycle sensor histidine kinase and response regulator CckA